MTTHRYTDRAATAARHLVEASALNDLIGLAPVETGDAYEVDTGPAMPYAGDGQRWLLALLADLDGGTLYSVAMYLDEPNKEAVLGAVGRLFGMRVLTMREVGR